MPIRSRHSRRLAVVVGILSISLAANAAFDFDGWSWRRSIDTGGASGFVRLDISPEIFDQSQPSLNDLRILDGANNLVPFVVRWIRVPQHGLREPRPLQMLNATFEPGKFSRVTLDFGSPVDKTQVRVALSGNNYRRPATIEGSTDSLNWEKIAGEFWLFDVTLPEKSYKFDTLNFPTNNFRYLRLTVRNMPDDPSRITIDSAEASFIVQTPSSLKPLDAKLTASRQDDKAHESIFDFDIGHRNLPVAAVDFGFSDPWFHRGYDLLGRNSTSESVSIRRESGSESRERETPWEPVRSGILYRILEKDRVTESASAEDLTAPYRYLQLRVQNGDNSPLKLTSATAYLADVALVFESNEGDARTLIGGNPNCGGANFDMASAMHNLDVDRRPVVTYGPLESLQTAQILAPWTERHANLLWLALIIAATGMVGLILKNLRQSTGSEPKP